MEKYINNFEVIPKDKRAEINTKILSLITREDYSVITKEDIFNAYTGIGGLHGLDRKDYKNSWEWSEAKKDIEHGQFFTPHEVCKQVADLLSPSPTDTVADICCGIGNFFNYFQEQNCFGCDVDQKAVSVAKALYPESYIRCESFEFFTLDQKVDYVIGNPPFNLWMTNDGKSIYSQFYFFLRAAKIIKPGGIIVCVVPESFLKDEFFNKSSIEGVEKEFSFVGQYKLSKDTFKNIGVASFPTKVMVWQKTSEHIAPREYDNTFTTYDKLKIAIDELQKERKKLAVKLKGELLVDMEDVLSYKIKKYLYEIKTHKNLQPNLPRALAYIDKYRNQKCPDGMEYSEWQAKHKITDKDVLRYIKRLARYQKPPEEKIELVFTGHDFHFKSYSNKMKRKLSLLKQKQWNLNKLITDVGIGINHTLGNELRRYRKFINRRTNDYKLQNTPFHELERDPHIDNFLRRYQFRNKNGEACNFNKIQRHDLGLVLQKRYSILAWQQGGGKTAGGLAWSDWQSMRNTFVISTSMAINMTWIPFLKANNRPFRVITKMKDIDNIKKGEYVLLSFHYLIQYERQLKRYVRVNSQKVSLIFDESDEITNNASKRTKVVLNIFRKVRKKLLTTGTTTRNNIGELYSQLELLYNNSVNFISYSRMWYIEKRITKSEALYDDMSGVKLIEQENKYYGKPFPPYFGKSTFTRCFNPSKSTVFGINKHNQYIYNEEDLRDIIEKTIITRKFREIAGDKYDVENTTVFQDSSERAVYRKIVSELDQIIPNYFNSTGDSRKDSMLKLMRQLTLLIEATSAPQSFDFYRGSGVPTKALKIKELIAENPTDKICIGCTSIFSTTWYEHYTQTSFPDRKVFRITGDVPFKKREAIIKEFEDTEDGILVCTQQSLKSSVSIPSCDYVVVESLQWNIPKVEQFYFRFIRYDSKNRTKVVFVNYGDTIEVNLLALLMAKEKLNDYIKTLEYRDDSDIYEEYDINLDILNNLITKNKDEDGKITIQWGEGGIHK